MLQQYPHFNPTNYKLDVKIATVRTSPHSKHNINYHLVWIPKYRKKALYKQLRQYLPDIFKDLARQKECKIEEGHICFDRRSLL